MYGFGLGFELEGLLRFLEGIHIVKDLRSEFLLLGFC